ncbi:MULTISPECIES: DoxX family protein [Methylovorus]|uniref:DoxX family protein n=1 Tax=Methylovorus glucosotrophus (strain SIP3-4) TaxID=582744 RepID=C6XBP5_METGS|nr:MULTISPECIES: DoxX family protein [Methylovorus]ACT52015.1 DoxX family protein [Methylovorus glucosotrophus SIP3-4]ADQ85860.1 DoxX family protein [Methylovorus sp. MP688]KAF0842712.1 putative oxidoreductase [Methylovorus glucosotrophus]
MNPCNRWLTFAGRVLLSLIFIISGLGKVAAPDATIGYISSVGAPFPEVAYAIALVVELGLGLALLLGFKAKFAAAGIAIFTLAAALLFHTDFSNQIQLVMFMKNFTIIGGLLLIVAYGAGGFSLDNRK